MSKRKEYSIYKGEKEIFVGTIEEVMNHFNVKKKLFIFGQHLQIKKEQTQELEQEENLEKKSNQVLK